MVSAKGNIVSAKGNTVSAKGNMVSAKGIGVLAIKKSLLHAFQHSEMDAPCVSAL